MVTTTSYILLGFMICSLASSIDIMIQGNETIGDAERELDARLAEMVVDAEVSQQMKDIPFDQHTFGDFQTFQNLKVKDVCAGGYYTTIQREDGIIFQTGLGTLGGVEILFHESDPDLKIVKISCGDAHTLALDDKGRIWSWGSKGNILGHSEDASPIETPIGIAKKVIGLEDKFIVDISAGYDFSLAITDKGKAFIWGSGDYFQIKFGQEVLPIPEMIKTYGHITAVCAAGHHMVLLNKHLLLTMGSSAFGRLGQGEPSDDGFLLNPGLVKFSQKIANISCGGDHTFAKTRDGVLYAWGWNEHGQLGLNHATNAFEPVEIPYFKDRQVTFFGQGKYGHSFAIADGSVYTWGWNDEGQLGTDDRTTHLTPVRIPLENVKKIVGGYRHTLALHDDGTLTGWGDNVFKQLELR
eukprot:TRINITY_DN15442_c0_g1_i1.p1 TRINITY_DN15442_c0_g1~~TRINITY_DN15442_c0_g1_i1.p1  ORF type:complete len:411 (+),score=82.74 TRINITY_DN15442_c0_g1_i1:83-1315(+)